MRTPQQAFKDAQESGAIDAWLDGKEIQYAPIEQPDKWCEFYGDTPNWSSSHLIWGPKPLTFPAPPEGEEWHNPDNLTPGQVGEGYRLLLKSEISYKRERMSIIEMWVRKFNRWDASGWSGCIDSHTHRVPASTPFHWDKPKTIRVPLGPEDVPPGSVIRGLAEANSNGWSLITSCSTEGLRVWRSPDFHHNKITWDEAMWHWQILRPGRDPVTGWEPCWKEVEKKGGTEG